MAWLLPLLQFPAVSPLAHHLPPLNPFSLWLSLGFLLCLFPLLCPNPTHHGDSAQVPPFPGSLPGFPNPRTVLSSVPHSSHISFYCCSCHLPCSFPLVYLSYWIGNSAVQQMLSKGTSNDSVSFNFIPNPLIKGRSSFGDVQVPQDTELLRSRARAEMRRAWSKPLWFPSPPQGGACQRRESPVGWVWLWSYEFLAPQEIFHPSGELYKEDFLKGTS